MSKYKLPLLAVLPLLFAASAFADEPAPGTPPAPPSMHQGEWHKSMCGEMYAHKSARLAYLEAKLDLAAQQKPLWNKWQQIENEGAQKERAACLKAMPKDGAHPSLLDHRATMEIILGLKLQNLQASRPALQALYDSLTPEQKKLMDRPHGHQGGHGGPGHHMHGEHD